ncbi:hypothetical protein EVAR_28239_1 [Eumeta japonica]|uniref:Uncharacterized protein n=1 Tax=Eumeta variegata TaxID=151549 RepID=A0A4C1V8M6_EUMVA|nr:hypothetical protein EVAR_28239_1 [Eumeta japonica]
MVEEMKDLLVETGNYKRKLLNYECDTQRLKSKKICLNTSLQSITAKYELAQKEMGDHTLAIDNLIYISRYNYERFESLITKHQYGTETPPVDASRRSVTRRLLGRAPAAVSPHSGPVSRRSKRKWPKYYNV